jgi:CubicO group peptidase (beta-lactamase class C family)
MYLLPVPFRNILVRKFLACTPILFCGWLSVALVSCTHLRSEHIPAGPKPDSLSHNDSIALLFNPVEAHQKALRIDSFFRDMQATKGFNGTALIAQHGRVIYKGVFGWADFAKKDSLSVETSFQLASVSKQFTAMAIMMLRERGKLSYEDEITEFFPEFPYTGITVRHLLNHRSGLPDYTYFCDKHFTDRRTPISNNRVLEMLTQHRPDAYFLPDRRFDYSNTGYFLLASIVEKVAGMPFTRFMEANIFRPLGMSRTFIYEGDAVPLADVATGYTGGRRRMDACYLNGVVGDKGIYSTVEDLFKWDRALYSEKLVKETTLAEACEPGSKELKKQNYGFGWRLLNLDCGDPVVYHGGWWKGFKSYLMRNPKDQSTIIVLTNVANNSLMHLKGLQSILYPQTSVEIPADTLAKEGQGGER